MNTTNGDLYKDVLFDDTMDTNGSMSMECFGSKIRQIWDVVGFHLDVQQAQPYQIDTELPTILKQQQLERHLKIMPAPAHAPQLACQDASMCGGSVAC